ncbi:MAG: peptidoglycan-binding protein [Ferrovibrio sp.]|uniref:peptidoglycan-binding protein n=1 Tax=Ferrovibrio sp. TaxID=1917215 RepID=UPI00391C3CEF
MPAYQRLFDPPRQDDLEYLPDPLGRLDMGSYVEKPADIPDPGWDAARGDWMDGAPLGRIFGDRLFDLQSGVGAGQTNRRADVFKLQALLHREGVLDAAATEGPTGYWGGRDDYALRKFQKENGLTIDGYALPDGETIETIKGFYTPPAELRIRTMEKRGGYPEPQLRPIGLGSDRPIKPTLLSSDRSTQQEAQADTGMTGNLPAVPDMAVAETPLLYRGQDRERSILQNTPGRIRIQTNPKADSKDPWYLVNGAGRSAVMLHDDIIRREAAKQKVDPDLIRAIIYAENARGHYFGAARAAEGLGKAGSIFPMNINPEKWRDLGFAGRNPSNPEDNIRVGVTLVKRIIDRLENPTPEAIGTLYNSLPQDRVTDYGAYIGRLLQEKPWRD